MSLPISTSLGAAHFQHDIGGERIGGGADPRAGGGEIGVGRAGGVPGAAFDDDVSAERDKLLDRLRARGDPLFLRIRFRDHPDQHVAIPDRQPASESRRRQIA